MDREGLRQPLSGWLGHAAPFEFAPSYRPAAGIARFVCGTPPILAMRALECGLEVFGEAEALGGMAALRDKSIALTALFIERVEASCAGLGLTLASPRAPAERGSQVSFAHADGYPVMQALIERGVVGDFRAGQDGGDGHLLRFGFTPLYTRFVDAWDAAAVLARGARRRDLARAALRATRGGDLMSDPKHAATGRRRRGRRQGGLQPRHELRRLPPSRRRARRAAAPLGRARRDAVHHPAPGERAVDEAAAARARGGDRRGLGRRAAPRLQDARPGEQDHGAAGPRLGRAGDDDAARVLGDASLARLEQRLPELAVPDDRVPPRQQERGDAEAACAPARPARPGAGGARRAVALRRGDPPAGAARPAAAGRARSNATGRRRARRAKASSRPGSWSTATRRPTGTSTSSAKS